MDMIVQVGIMYNRSSFQVISWCARSRILYKAK